MRVWTSILHNDSSSTRGRTYRAAAETFSLHPGAEEVSLGSGRSLLKADVADLPAFLTELDDALIAMDAEPLTITVAPAAIGIHVVGDATYDPLVSFDETPAAAHGEMEQAPNQ